MDNEEKFEYSVIRHVCTLSGEDTSVTKELNIISFAGNKPKYDLRSWKTYPDGTRKLLKGVTLTDSEMKILKAAIIAEPLEDPEPAAGQRRTPAQRKPRANRNRANLPELKEPLIDDLDFFESNTDYSFEEEDRASFEELEGLINADIEIEE